MLNFILNLLFPKSTKIVESNPQPTQIITPEKQYITLDDWITSSGRYKERKSSPELTPEVIANAIELVSKVNKLLNSIKWTSDISLSSGFRPSDVNANVPGAAKKSGHTIGLALDIFQDKNSGNLGTYIRSLQKTDNILGSHELMMESLESTVGKNSNWVHLDTVKRTPRPSMEFKP
jgi:hypothetical protein